MSSDREQSEVVEKENKAEVYKRNLQVNSVVYPSRRENEWNRKAHSSPIKGYRRFSDQDSNGNTKVNNPRTSCIFEVINIDFSTLVTLSWKNCNGWNRWENHNYHHQKKRERIQKNRCYFVSIFALFMWNSLGYIIIYCWMVFRMWISDKRTTHRNCWVRNSIKKSDICSIKDESRRKSSIKTPKELRKCYLYLLLYFQS